MDALRLPGISLGPFVSMASRRNRDLGFLSTRKKSVLGFLSTTILLASVLALIWSSAAKAEEQGATGPSAEVSGQTEPTVKDPQKDIEAFTFTSRKLSPPVMASPSTPPLPDPKAFDWIRLTSNEWLKGDLIAFRNGKLEFDSDEMDEQEFDWEDIAEMHSPREHTYVFLDKSVVIGTAVIREGKVLILSEGEVREFPDKTLLGIVPGKPREINYWDGKASVGLSIRSGNTNQKDFSYQGWVRRQEAFTRTRVDLNGNIGSVEGEKNANSHRGTAKFDIFLSKRFYVTPASFQAYLDEFQNIEYQLTPGAGGGYHAIKSKKIECDIELLGAYQYMKFISVQPGESIDSSSGAAVGTIRIETEPTKWLDFDMTYTGQLGIPDPKESIQHLLAVLSVEITEIFDFDVSFTWDRTENPKADSDGKVPERNDFRLSVGVGVDF